MPEASLKILPGAADPRDISRSLGIEPTKMVKRGQRAEPGMLDTAATESEWLLSSRDAVPRGDASAHLSWLLGQVGDKGKQLVALRDSGTAVYLTLVYDTSGARSLNLRSDQVRQLAAVGLDIELRFER